jgi:hypothetical protein
MAQPERRRRRLRHHSAPAAEPQPPGVEGNPGAAGPGTPGAADPGSASADTSAVHDVEVPGVPGAPPARTRAEEREAERGLRGLVGSGSSQVSNGAALRARDASRPDDDDLAAAERDLVIIRRKWVPREELPRGR